MQKLFSAIVRLGAAAGTIATLSGAGAAPLAPSPEDRYVASRDAAIAKFSPIYDAGKSDDARACWTRALEAEPALAQDYFGPAIE